MVGRGGWRADDEEQTTTEKKKKKEEGSSRAGRGAHRNVREGSATSFRGCDVQHDRSSHLRGSEAVLPAHYFFA